MAILQMKRGNSARLNEVNPILSVGEPCAEYDTHRMKIGDGKTAWRDLPYVGHDSDLTLLDRSAFPEVGEADRLYKDSTDQKIYQWNDKKREYEPLGTSFNPDMITLINGGSANGTN